MSPRAYVLEDDAPHPDGDDPSWQESTLFCWFDEKIGLGGFYRLGHETLAGLANGCFAVFTPDERFRWNVTGVPYDRARDRSARHMSLGPTRADLDGQLRITTSFEDCQADLNFLDYHGRFETGDLQGVKAENHQHSHFEVAGLVTGTVLLGGRSYTVSAQAYRDRSWGIRRWGRYRSSRWWPNVFGPDLSIHVVHSMYADPKLSRRGYAMVDGQPHKVVRSEINMPLADDGLTFKTAQLEVELDNGQHYSLMEDVRDGVVMEVKGNVFVEAIGVVTCNGRTGFSNLEANTNPLGGVERPVFAIHGFMHDGLARAPWPTGPGEVRA